MLISLFLMRFTGFLMKSENLSLYDRLFKPRTYTLEDGKQIQEKRSRLPLVLIILLIAAILLVIVKCFNISFKKKQTDTADAGETEISAEGRKSVRSAPENKAKPKTVVQKQKKDDKPKVVKKTTETKKESVATADEEDVADSCQLP